MANPVTYNSGSNPTGALKFGTMSMSVATSLNITGYNWRNGFENNNIWVIYSDTFSQGQSTQGNSVPTIWATPIFTDQGLIDMINVLPARAGQTAFTTLSSAISWLVGEGKYFLSNQNYPQTPVSDLCFFVDAGFTASFPNLGTVWYDLSGNVKNLTLTNGPSWSSSVTKSSFTMDGADDNLLRASSIMTSTTGTVVMWLSTTDTTWLWIRGNNQSSYYLGATYPTVGWYNSNCGAPTYYVDTTVSTNPHTEGVLDGRFHMFEAKNVDLSSWTNYDILYYPSFEFNGKVAKILMYNKSLSSSESAVLYYQGDIVTSGLVFCLDAANIISYFNTGTLWYNLAQNINGTLTNGPTYNSAFGGVIQFDGTNDYVNTTYNSAYNFSNANFTVEAWFNSNPIANGTSSIICTRATYGTNERSFELYIFNDSGTPYIWFGVYNGVWTYVNNSSLTNIEFNRWNHVVATSDGQGNGRVYVNGVLRQTNSSFNTGVSVTTVPFQIGAFVGTASGGYFNGKISNVKLYNRALTGAEVQQNYGAYRNRYQSYAAFANGGTVTTISQNGINYRVHTFTSSGSLSIVEGGSVEVLVVAGGGSGGGSTAGGGGAGGLTFDNSYEVTAGQTITVTVGAGGSGVGPVTVGNDGNSSAFGVLSTTGGGGGGMTTGGGGATGRNGGSGGGGAHYSAFDFSDPGTGIAGQGYAGGDGGTGDQNSFPGGGGGGAGAVGGNATNSKSGNGGFGQPYALAGSSVFYAGGGGGGSSSNGGDGGNGGGGAGTSNGNAGANGTANTGGGGGGGWLYCCGSGGAGGSGIVIVRYPVY